MGQAGYISCYCKNKSERYFTQQSSKTPVILIYALCEEATSFLLIKKKTQGSLLLTGKEMNLHHSAIHIDGTELKIKFGE